MRWGPALRRLEWLVARPIAHRGLHDLANGAVENTATAFARAIDCDYAIECDVQISADGEAVVFHDDRLERVTEGIGEVKAHSARALKKIAFRAGNDRIQALGELLDQVGGKVPLIIEVKSRWDGDDRLAKRVLGVLAAYRGCHAVMSFDPDIVAVLRSRSPRTVRGIVTDRTVGWSHLPFRRRLELRYFDHMWLTMPHFISYAWADLPWPPVSLFRQRGGPVISWTIRTPEQASRALRYSDQITFEGFLA